MMDLENKPELFAIVTSSNIIISQMMTEYNIKTRSQLKSGPEYKA